jgi:hypothetical protein
MNSMIRSVPSTDITVVGTKTLHVPFVERVRFNEKYDYDLKQTTLHGLDPTTTQKPLETDYIAATKGAC